MEDNLQFINSKRKNNAEFHLMLAQKWRRYGEPKLLNSPLIYSALEFRMSIERIIFELFALMKRLRFVSEEDESKYGKITNVITQIMEIVENNKYLYRILMFNAILYQSELNAVGQLSVPNVNKLKNYWYSLSDYCHMKINPETSWSSNDYVMKGYEFLNEVENYLWDIKVRKQFGFYRFETWQPEVIQLAEDYINSIIDESSVRTRLLLMKPVILSRYRK